MTTLSSLLSIISLCLIWPTSQFKISWKTSSSIHMPQTVSSQLVCYLNETIYFFGGQTDTGYSDKMYLKHKNEKHWTLLNETLPDDSATFASNYVCYKNKIYIFGPLGTSQELGQLWIFDTTTNTLNTSLKMPIDVYFPCVALDPTAQLVYVLGGSTGHPVNTSLIFNIKTQEFENNYLKEMPVAVSSQMCVFLHKTNSILSFGGEADNFKGVDTILQYKISTNEWEKIGKLRVPRKNTNAVYHEKKKVVYIVGGGMNDTFLNSTEVFNVNTNKVVIADGELNNDGIQYNTVTMDGDQLINWGGYGVSQSNLNQIDMSHFSSSVNKSLVTMDVEILAGFFGFTFLMGAVAWCVCVKCQPKKEIHDDDEGSDDDSDNDSDDNSDDDSGEANDEHRFSADLQNVFKSKRNDLDDNTRIQTQIQR